MRYKSAISEETSAEAIANDLRGKIRPKYVFIPFAANMITGDKTTGISRVGDSLDANDSRPVQI
jgi:peptidase E